MNRVILCGHPTTDSAHSGFESYDREDRIRKEEDVGSEKKLRIKAMEDIDFGRA